MSSAGGPLPLTLGYAPGLIDVPDALFTSPLVFGDVILKALRSNADWNGSCLEVFLAIARDGDSVTLPRSPCTGYQYQPFECFIVPALASSLPFSGSPSASGQLLVMGSGVTPDLAVKMSTSYYVQGGQDTPTSDGSVLLWVVCQRGWGKLQLSSAPGFTDIADSSFAQDSPVTQTLWRQLNQNCKLPRREFFLNNCVPVVSASRGSSLVTAYTLRPHGLVAGDPFYYFYPDDETFQSSTATALPAGYGQSAGAYVVISAPTPTSLTWLQVGGVNARTAGGRIQKAFYKDGDTMPPPVSPFDGYAYSYSELRICPIVSYTGNPNGTGPSGAGRIRRLGPFSVDPVTGVVSSNVRYYDGTNVTDTHDGRLQLAVFAQRALAGSPPFSQPAVSYNGDDELLYLAQARLTDAIIQHLNQDAKESIGRPEFFFWSITGDGAQIAVTASPLDNSLYARSQLLYLATLYDTADVGTGCLGSFSFQIAQNTNFWAPGTDYAVGTSVIDTNGAYQNCATAGTSGDDAPNWPYPWQPNTTYKASGYGPGGVQGQIVIDGNGNQQICTTPGVSGSSPPTWNTSGTTNDNGVVWTFYKTGEQTVDNTVVWSFSGVAGDEAGKMSAVINGSSSAALVAQGIMAGFRS